MVYEVGCAGLGWNAQLLRVMPENIFLFYWTDLYHWTKQCRLQWR